mmetsp:Transcript_19307/g.27160  ORF Transcript_19307/g.27160 Transcript_19307/m.27160 type:complete len:111 (-) Transcript_19307:438-770(-)
MPLILSRNHLRPNRTSWNGSYDQNYNSRISLSRSISSPNHSGNEKFSTKCERTNESHGGKTGTSITPDSFSDQSLQTGLRIEGSVKSNKSLRKFPSIGSWGQFVEVESDK